MRARYVRWRNDVGFYYLIFRAPRVYIGVVVAGLFNNRRICACKFSHFKLSGGGTRLGSRATFTLLSCFHR